MGCFRLKKLLYVDKSIIILCVVNFILLLSIYIGEIYYLTNAHIGGSIEVVFYRVFIMSNLVVYFLIIVFAFWMNLQQYSKNKRSLSKKELGWRIFTNTTATIMPFLLSLFLYWALQAV